MTEAKHDEPTKFEPAAAAQYWQRSVSSWMKANERIMRGLVSVAQREMELGQELLKLNLTAVNLPQTADRTLLPDYATQLQQNFKGIELVMTGAREIAGDLTQCLTDATKTLFEELSSVSQEAARETAATVTRETEKAAGRLLKTGQNR